MISRKISIFLDRVRQQKKITLESFTKDIVSIRQYKRYLYGESDIPHKVLVLLTERLDTNPTTILREFDKAKFDQLQSLFGFYNLVVTYNFNEAKKFQKENSLDSIFDDKHKIFYQISSHLLQFYLKNESQFFCAEEISKLINYPKIIKQGILDFVDIMGLSILLTFISSDKKDEILDKLYNVLLHKDVAYLGDNVYTEQFILLKLAKEYGIKHENERVITLCTKGINTNKKNFSYFNLDYFYYYCALAHRNLKDMKKAHEALKLSYISLLIQNNKQNLDKFLKLFKEDFNLTEQNILKMFMNEI